MQHKFVEFIPTDIKTEILYISIEYKTVAHLCACGCGKEVITPITPTDWKLIYDGATISLHPSIGNWDFKCRSHYWIKNNNIVWAEQWNDKQITSTKENDAVNKGFYYKDKKKLIRDVDKNSSSKQSFLSKLFSLFFAK